MFAGRQPWRLLGYGSSLDLIEFSLTDRPGVEQLLGAGDFVCGGIPGGALLRLQEFQVLLASGIGRSGDHVDENPD